MRKPIIVYVQTIPHTEEQHQTLFKNILSNVAMSSIRTRIVIASIGENMIFDAGVYILTEGL